MEVLQLNEYLLSPVAQVALIMGLAEVIKRIGLNSRWIPLVDVFLGLLSGVCVYGLGKNLGILNGIVIGLAMGLSACGLFSGIKNVTKGAEE